METSDPPVRESNNLDSLRRDHNFDVLGGSN